MNEQTLRFRIGVFVLASLLLLAVLITLFGSFPRLFVRAHEYTVRFSSAPGVEQGTPVRLSGIRVGEVRRITLDDEGVVRVQIVIEHPYTLRRNERPTLMQGMLGGDTSIDFVRIHGEGEADTSPVPPGSELAGVREPTMNSVITQASEVLPSTQETLNDIRKSVQRYEKMAPLLEETAREYRDLARATRDMIPELRKTNDEVRELAKASRETVPELRKAATEVGGVARSLNDTMPDVRRTNEEIRELAKEARQTLPDLRKSTNEVGALARETRETLPELRKTNDQMQATLITWQKTGERAKLILEKNDEKVGESLDRLNNTLSDENQRNLTASLRNLRTGTENLPTISKKTEELVTESQRAMRRANDAFGQADEVMSDLKKATRPFAERDAAIAKNLDEGASRLNSVASDMQELLKAIDRGDGTLKKLINDPSLYNHVDEVACMVMRLLPRLEPILRDVNVFSDKIARHPESIGVRGAISPGSGLKESPMPLPLPTLVGPPHP
jgi:ABC-type transporter Mla subunit MlaD